MQKQMITSEKQELINRFWQSCLTGIRSFKATKPRKWLQEHGLDLNDLQLGFSSGQFGHRKSEAFKQEHVQVGLLVPSKAAVKEPHLKAYTCFGTYAIVFPLKDEKGSIVNLYSIRIKNNKEKTKYLNGEGLFPGYPSVYTEKLYITSSILEAISLIQSKTIENRDAVLALNDGELKPQHIQAIQHLKQLKQIIFIRQI